MAKANNKNHSSDFNEEELVNVDQHKADIDKIHERLTKLETKFGTNECIADTIFSVTERDTKMQKMLSDVVIRLIGSDIKVRDSISKYLDEADKRNFAVFGNRIGFALWSIALLIIGAILQPIVQSMMKLPK